MIYDGKDISKHQHTAELFADHFSIIFSTAKQNSNIYSPLYFIHQSQNPWKK